MTEVQDNSGMTNCPCGSGIEFQHCCGKEGRTALNADVYACVNLEGITSENEITPEIKQAIETVTDNPQLFPARVNLPNNRAWFVKMSPMTFRESVFLDPGRMKGTCVIESDLSWLQDKCKKITWQPTSFLFHSAFCGSTLMSQVLERVYQCLSLREPELLGNILYFQNSEAQTDQKTFWLDGLLKLLSRRFDSDAPVIVKANDHANSFMPLLLNWQPDIPVLFMYTPLNEFISGCLKADNRKDWIKNRYESIFSHLVKVFPHANDVNINSSNHSEIAAAYWSYNLAMYLQISSLNRISVKSLDFNDMLDNPVSAIQRCGQFFGLKEKDDVHVQEIVDSAFGVYSKNSSVKYSPEQRHKELQKQFSQFENEQASGERIARSLLKNHYPEKRLPNDLLSNS